MLVHVQLDGSERVVSLAELEELIRAGDVGGETPVRADVLTGGRWVPLGELELYKGLQGSPQALVRRAWAAASVPWFSVILVGIQIRVFLWTSGTPIQGELVNRWARYTPAIIERDEFARLVSYGFFHGDFGHIAGNMLYIAFAGVALEAIVGSLSVATLFFASVFWGAVVSSLLSPADSSIGASAGDFGLMAAAAVFALRWGDLLPPQARLRRFGLPTVLYVVYALVAGMMAKDGIDNWAHLGGLVAGGTLMVLLRPNVTPAWRARNQRISFTALLLMVAGVIGMARVPIPLVPVEEDGLVASRPVWWATGWAPTGESGWASPVGGGVLVTRTTHAEAPVGTAAAVSALLADYREIDPLAALQDEQPIARDGVEGRFVKVGYESAGTVRQVQAAVFARGRYVHRVVLDVPVDEARARGLAKRLFARVELPLPKAIAEARGAGESWRGRLERAEAEADIGDPGAARALIEGVRQETPGEPAAAEALLELFAAYPAPEAAAIADQLLAAFPDDRGVRAAAVRAVLAAGDREGALRRLDDGLTAAPGDRKLTRLRRELFE